MTGTTNQRMLNAYFQTVPRPTSHFTGMFQAPEINFHDSEEVELDIVRSGEKVAIVVQDMSTGYRMNTENLFTNKSFKPPVFKEAFALNSFELMKRQPGQNPFQNPEFRAQIVARVFKALRDIEDKVRRAVELQASQVLQTGTVSLTDEAGTVLYTIDYKPKAAHFPTAGVSWATATLAQKIADLTALCNTIRSNGRVRVDELNFGSTAWENLLSTDGFLARFDSLRANLGSISPMDRRGDGGIFRGVLELGNYKLDVYTYDGRYDDPQTGISTEFMDPGKVVAKYSGAVLNATFGGIPNIGQILGVNGRLLPELPSRLSSSEFRMDMAVNAWLSPDGEQLMAGMGSRPLLMPTAIDQFGCLTTQL